MKLLVVLALGALAVGPALATGELGPESPAEAPEVGSAPPGVEPEPAPEPAGQVARAGFTTAVVDREPTDSVATLTTETSAVLFFTELVGMTGHTVTHRWEFKGEVIAEVAFDVGGPRWRVYSSKQLMPGWEGRWTVTVVGESGAALHTAVLDYAAAPAADDADPAPDPVPAAPDEPAAFRPGGAPEPDEPQD